MEERKRRAKGEGSVFKLKDGRWGAAFSYRSLEGKIKRKYLYAKTEEEVLARLEAAQKQIGPMESRRVGKHSFEAYAWEWLHYHGENVKPHTVELYERELRTLVLPHIGLMPLEAITAKHIKMMQSAILKTGKSDSAKRSRKSAYRVLKSAYLEGLISRNPAEGVASVRHKPKRKKIWTVAEAQTFLEIANGHPYYAMFLLALVTGLRPSELYALEWDCVFENELLVKHGISRVSNKLTRQTPKSDAGHRYVPLPGDAKAVLDSYAPKKLKGLVFPNVKGKPLNASNVRLRMFYPLLEKAGLERTELYTLRHAYASMHIAAGTDIARLAKWMGHADPSFTMKYYVQAFDRADKSVALSAAELLGIKKVDPSQGRQTLELRLGRSQLDALVKGEAITLQLSAQ